MYSLHCATCRNRRLISLNSPPAERSREISSWKRTFDEEKQLGRLTARFEKLSSLGMKAKRTAALAARGRSARMGERYG